MKSNNLSYWTLLFFAIYLGCSSSPTTSTRVPSNETQEKAPLTHASLTLKQAQQRFQQVQNVRYHLEFQFTEKENFYTGVSEIHFDFKPQSEDLLLDYFKGDVQKLSVNGQQIPINYNGATITVPEENLTEGSNQIQVQFKSPFVPDGLGIIRFQDPVDQKVYIYTQLEPFHANSVFPLFDQPDLKATFKMKVTAPKSWQVITSVLESQKVIHNKNQQTWHFPRSAKMSSYVWSLIVGDYAVFQSKAGDIPLRLFVRQSFKKYVKPQDWFPVTQQGLAFFSNYFDYQYPFQKYDQIICPNFSAGAMENVAAVTFSERFVKRGAKTRGDRLGLANVILHEMAHMWFGDLVTMKWWDDLWLNESFATYMASLALYEATEFKEAWRDFNGEKQWAYWEDQLVTTHPIVGEVHDTATAMSRFDGITYGKGAASMQQLSYYIGPDQFKRGLQIYFDRHAYGNTTLNDFMQALSEGTKKDLNEWNQKWLQTAQLNTLHLSYTCENNQMANFKVSQTAPKEYPTLRPHKFQLGFFTEGPKGRTISRVLAVTLDSEEVSVTEANGLPCNTIIAPNYQDYGYFKAELDPKTLSLLKKDLYKITDTFQRQQFWSQLWDMLIDGQLSVYQYADLYLNQLNKETDDLLLTQVIYRIYGRWGMGALDYMPKSTEKDQKLYSQYLQKTEEWMWKNLLKSKGGSDLQKTWLEAYTKTASTPQAIDRISQLLKGKIQLKKLKLDQDRRWALIYRLAEFNYPNISTLIDQEFKKDPTDSGKKWMLTAKAVQPQWENKKQWIENAISKKGYTDDELKSVLRSLFPSSQESLRKKYHEQFYTDLKSVMSKETPYYTSRFLELLPDVCEDGSQSPITPFIESEKEHLHPMILKELRISRQEAERCYKIRAKAQDMSESF